MEQFCQDEAKDSIRLEPVLPDSRYIEIMFKVVEQNNCILKMNEDLIRCLAHPIYMRMGGQ